MVAGTGPAVIWKGAADWPVVPERTVGIVRPGLSAVSVMLKCPVAAGFSSTRQDAVALAASVLGVQCKALSWTPAEIDRVAEMVVPFAFADTVAVESVTTAEAEAANVAMLDPPANVRVAGTETD